MGAVQAALLFSAIVATSLANSVVSDFGDDAAERQLAPATCGGQCRFKFCDDTSGFRFGRADTRFSGAICKIDGTPIGIVGGSGQALVGGTIPISEFRPNGLRQPYSRSFFKTFSNTGCALANDAPRRTSGVGHETPQQNQLRFLNKKCLVLPLRAYQVVDPVTGNVVNNVNTNDPLDCIDFRMETPKILLELTWDSGDDLDLRVTEPDGNLIFYADRVSPTGGMLLNDDRGTCSAPCYEGRERTVYDCGSTPLRGKYTVNVNHFSNCGDGPTRWTLRFFRNGVLRSARTRRGTSNQDNNRRIGMLMFNF